MDLRDLEHNTRDGVHIASLAGAWTAAVAGFGGMRDHDGQLAFAPRLPPRLERLVFRLLFRGRRLRVDVSRIEATYVLVAGEPLDVTHHGMPVTLAKDGPVTELIPPIVQRSPPSQPPGREPARRVPDSAQ
jgi:alpha,alpha-trehalose phosphorylase